MVVILSELINLIDLIHRLMNTLMNVLFDLKRNHIKYFKTLQMKSLDHLVINDI
jgi:hypothetical protein